MKKRLILWTVVIFLMAASAAALGMIPAKTTVDFLPNESKIYELTIVNNDHIDMELSIYPGGELAPFIEVLDPEVIMSNEEDYKKIRFKINPVGDLLSPGVKEGRIVIEEGLKRVRLSSNSVSARLKLNHKIFLESPYPDKYLESEISIDDLGSDLEIKNRLKNKGSLAINRINIDYEIKEGSKTVESMEEEVDEILSKDEQEINSYVSKRNVDYGEYELKAVMDYDGNSLELNRIFSIGRPDIDIRSYNRYLISNKINEFNIDIENKWNKILKDIYFEIELFDGRKKVYDSKSISFNIPPKGSRQIRSYIDTRDMDEKEYMGSVKVHIGEEVVEKEIEINVISEEEYSKTGSGGGLGLWIALVNMFLLSSFILYYFVRRKRR